MTLKANSGSRTQVELVQTEHTIYVIRLKSYSSGIIYSKKKNAYESDELRNISWKLVLYDFINNLLDASDCFRKI